jgi:hypothetical protein
MRPGTMRKLIASGLVAAAVGLLPVPADAQIYELIKVCKRKWQTAVACIVIEKGVEKVVEKSAEEWLSYYRKGNDKPAPSAPPLVVTAPTGPKNLTLGEIARNGTDFRDLMKDLDKKVGPAPVRNGDLVGILSSRCGLSPDSLSCREFKPLFVDHKSSCGAHLSMATCLVNDKCTWFLNSCTSKP